MFAVAISPDALKQMSTADLRALRQNYIQTRRALPRQHRSKGRSVNFPTDLRRCDDAISQINAVLRSRRLNRRPLAEFGR